MMTEKRRILDYGYSVGTLPRGRLNKITDVPGVRVGHWTYHSETQHTGVTVVMPCEDNIFLHKRPAAGFVLNGFGKTLGLVQLDELGVLETPIALTGTLNVGLVHDALVQYTLDECARAGVSVRSVNPVVGECNDGTLGDNRVRRVGLREVLSAMDDAGQDFEEGAVGGGAGLICHELKGGIGSSSRLVTLDGTGYTVGVLVQANHGQLADLTLCGNNIGRDIERRLKEQERHTPRPEDKGSCMMLLATDLPLSDRQLRRVVKRCAAGLVRDGSYWGHGSGDVCIGFSTANAVCVENSAAVREVTVLSEAYINPVFRAAAEACEEAVLNALCAAEPVRAADGTLCHALREFL